MREKLLFFQEKCSVVYVLLLVLIVFKAIK